MRCRLPSTGAAASVPSPTRRGGDSGRSHRYRQTGRSSMAGGSRRRRRRRELPPQPDAPAGAPASLGIREADGAEGPSKRTCDVLGSPSSSSLRSNAWENLLDSLLHQIIALISSFHDYLAFSGTCRSWRAAASSFPSVYTFTFPPLHLEPDISHGFLNYDPKWKLVTPAKRSLSLRCSAPRVTSHRMRFLGCSFGYLIFSDQEHCHLIDVYTGTKVMPPKLQFNGNSWIYYGILVAPLSSPNSQLILCSRTSVLQWQVGTSSWTVHPFVGELILQIVVFKGQMFAMDFEQRLHIIRLAPQFSIQEVAAMWEEGMLVGLHAKPWLVVCGDMLVLVDLSVSMDQLFGFPGTFQVFRLDSSDEPAKWVKMELENWALFLANDRRTPTFSCMNPERWGGKSNYIYVPTASEDFDGPWTAIEVGQPVPSSTHRMSFSSAATAHFSPLNSLWVLPSLVHGVCQ